MSRLLKLKRQVITEANKRVLNEQDDFYVEEIKPYLDKGYKEVDKIDLSDDTYYKDGGSHSFSVIDKWGNYTGYDIITTFGVKGRYSKDDGFEIIGGDPGQEGVHTILFKDVGFEPKTTFGLPESNQNIINKIKSQKVKNVSEDMINNDPFKGEYGGYLFGGALNGVNYIWDATGVDGMTDFDDVEKGFIHADHNTVLPKWGIEDADPKGVYVGFWDGKKMAFGCYNSISGTPKCKKM